MDSGTTAISGVPAADLLADLHGALGDHAIHRRDNAHMAQHNGGVAQLRFGRQHIGIVGDIGAFDLASGMRSRPALGGSDRGLRPPATASRAWASSSPDTAPSAEAAWRRL